MGYLSSALTKLGLAQPGPKITAQDRAILDLKLQRDKMKQYQKRVRRQPSPTYVYLLTSLRIQVVLDREQAIAKEALQAGNKRRALTALRQRKYQAQLLAKTDAQLQTLQDLVQTIEFTQIQATVMHGLSVGNDVLKQLHAEMSLERVEKLMDQTREGVEYQREIDETLMSKMSPEEEDAVQAELAELQREALPAIPSVPDQQPVSLPSVPVEEPRAAEQEAQTEMEAAEERVAMAA